MDTVKGGEIEACSRAPAENQGLSWNRKLLLAASTWLDWLTHVSWPPAVARCRVSCTTTRGPNWCLLFLLLYIFILFFNWLSWSRKQPSDSSVRWNKKQMKAQNSRQARESYFSCVIRHCGQWEQCVFSVVECGQSIWLPGEQRPDGLDFQIPEGFTVHASDMLLCVCVCCLCIHMFNTLLSILQQRLRLTQTGAAAQHRPSVYWRPRCSL